MLPTLLLACCLVGGDAAPWPADTAYGTAAASPASPVDSVRALNRARNSVRAYVRRATPATARDLRPDVVEQLDQYAREIPGDDWIAGHRIGMRIKQGWYSSAAAEALRCQASEWWCRALAGFALHVEGSQADAHRLFDQALAAMPMDVRCEWAAELLHVLEGELYARYAAADCQGRLAMEPRIWWLADPLHVLPGNDRRAEHYSRLVAMRLHHELLAAEGREPCAHEHHSGVIRNGWPPWWWGPGLPETGREGARFIPVGSVFNAPLSAGAGDWSLEVGAMSERFRPVYGDVRDIDHQAAFFLRGDSVQAVTAAALGRTRVGGVAFSRSEAEPPVVAYAREGGGLVLSAMLPHDEYLVSIEALREPSGAVRARFGHRLPEASAAGLRLSDVLLFSWNAALDETLEDVAPRMMPTTRFPRSRSVGMYWEVYGVADTTALEFALSAEPEDPGLLARLGQNLRLATPRDGVAIRWEAQGEAPDVVRTHTRIDFGSLPPGRYRLRLVVRQGDGPPAVATRAIELQGI